MDAVNRDIPTPLPTGIQVPQYVLDRFAPGEVLGVREADGVVWFELADCEVGYVPDDAGAWLQVMERWVDVLERDGAMPKPADQAA